MTKAEEQALKAYPNIKIGEQRIDQSSAREVYVEGYQRAQQDTIERACQILYDWNKQMTEMFGAKAVLSCNQFTIDVDRFRKLLELEGL
mgnify:CR=1 FL=1